MSLLLRRLGKFSLGDWEETVKRTRVRFDTKTDELALGDITRNKYNVRRRVMTDTQHSNIR